MIETQSKADEYRETAAKLRQIARVMDPGDAYTEIVELAGRFERFAEHAERRSRIGLPYDAVGRALPPSRLVGA